MTAIPAAAPPRPRCTAPPGMTTSTTTPSASARRSTASPATTRSSAGTADDAVFGGLGNDTIFANSGDDVVVGGDGDDLLVAESGQDSVHTGDGADQVFAGAGDDFIFLTDDGQTDTVYYLAGDGHDVIDNFEHGVDQVGIGDFGVTGFADISGLITYNADGSQAQIDLGGGDMITFTGLEAELQASDFVF